MSNRLTFSLASLIFILALGLVFVPTAVMAHGPGVTPAAVPETHDHPLNTNIVDDPTTAGVTESVTAHNHHPMVTSVVLKEAEDKTRGNMVVVTDPAAQGGAATDAVFTLVITFDRDIVTANNVRVVPTSEADRTAEADLVSDADFTDAILNVDGTSNTTAAIAFADGGRVAGSNNSLEVEATVSAAFPSGTAGENDREFTLRIRVNANAVFSLATLPEFTEVPGGNSLASSLYTFKLVNALPDAPDTTGPVPMVTAPEMPETDGTLVFNIDFGESVSGFSLGDVMVENGTKEDFITKSDGSFDVTIMPTNANSRVTVMVGAGVAMDTAMNSNTATDSATYSPEGYVSTVMLSAADGAGDDDGKVIFTLNFADKPNSFNVSALNVTNVELLKFADLQPVPMATEGYAETRMLTVTPTATATEVTLTIQAGALTTGMGDDEIPIDSAQLTHTLPTDTTEPTDPDRPPTDEPNVLRDLSVPAEGYVVLVRNKSTVQGLPTSVTDAQKITWAGMPDLESLFVSGGSLALTRNKTPQIDHDANTGTAARDAKVRDLIITEVMWARNLAVVGQTGETNHQWIEIYNPLKAVVSGVTVTTKARRPALTSTGDEIQLDMLSNIVGSGWGAFDIGQNGYLVENNPDASKIEFISMYRNNRGGDKHGWVKGHWSVSTETYLPNYKGTPGRGERAAVQTVGTTSFDVGPVIFNEVSNRNQAKYEWFELRNKSDSEQNLKNREIRIVKDVGSDIPFFQFGDQDAKIPAGGVLLCVFTDPRSDDEHPLATGWNIDVGANDQINGVGAHSARYIVINDHGKRVYNDDALGNEGFPDEFVLILRTRRHNDDVGKDTNIWDIAGYDKTLKVGSAEAGFTNLWPLKGSVRSAELSNNKWDVGTVHRRQKDNVWGTSSTNYGRNGGNHHDDTAWRGVGWTGIGYRRNADANDENGGTPGYPNNTLQSNETQAGADPVIISEIMYATGDRANMPQWIELYNTSKTVGINLDGWRVTITNHDEDKDGVEYAGDLSKDYAINGKIPPGQTFLLVAYAGRNETKLPSERIHRLRDKRGEKILSEYGFEITLLTKGKDNKDANRKLADRVGNLAVIAAADARVRRNPQSYEAPAWMLPMVVNEDGDRLSIVRASMKDGTPINGQTAAAWNRFDMSAVPREETSYGHGTDISSPGHTVGGVLPVSLSKFRPERMKDTGEIVIRWVTESELNNAGFNILRGEKLDGEFTKINTKLIAGQGTTSERTAYTYTDTSAKPNVVYYYQIQDVSLDGQVTTLRTTHLRGNVTAVGKATTTWGELKTLRE